MSRTLSARHTSSNGFKTSANVEFNPKVAHYHTNGGGRDTYIKFDNGGFRKQWENGYSNIYISIIYYNF